MASKVKRDVVTTDSSGDPAQNEDNGIIKAVRELESSKEFKDWRSKSKDALLVHYFRMDGPDGKSDIQIGYYDSATQRMCTFAIGEGKISHMPDLEVFKREDSPINPLDLTKVGFDAKSVLDLASKTQLEKYPGQPIINRFFVLQNLDLGQVYNVTFVTAAFKIINMKFDSLSGELLKHHTDTLFTIEKGAENLSKPINKPAKNGFRSKPQ